MKSVLLPKIIGVSGRLQSGKTTLCEYLTKKLESNSCQFKTIYFSDKLKEICKRVLGLSHEQCNGTNDEKNYLTNYKWDNLPDFIRYGYGEKKLEPISSLSYKEFGGMEYKNAQVEVVHPKTGFMTAREVMKVVGTDIFRNMFDENVWVNATINEMKEFNLGVVFDVIFIADVRFVSEIKAIIKENGYIIRLTRNINPSDNHPSEIELDNYNFSSLGEKCLVINNQGKDIKYKNKLGLEFLKKIISLKEDK